MTRVFKTRHFQRWMRKTELTDAVLCKAVQEMAAGLIDADLGGIFQLDLAFLLAQARSTELSSADGWRFAALGAHDDFVLFRLLIHVATARLRAFKFTLANLAKLFALTDII